MKPSDQLLGRQNRLEADGWTAVIDVLEGITALTSLNLSPSSWMRAISEGGQTEILVNQEYELGVFVLRYLERSASTLIRLDFRCAAGV